MYIDSSLPLLAEASSGDQQAAPSYTALTKFLPLGFCVALACALFSLFFWLNQRNEFDNVPNWVSFTSSGILCLLMLISARIKDHRKSTLVLALVEGLRATGYTFNFNWNRFHKETWVAPIQWIIGVVAIALHAYGLACATEELLFKGGMKSRREKPPISIHWWLLLSADVLAVVIFASCAALNKTFSDIWFPIVALATEGALIGITCIITFAVLFDIREHSMRQLTLNSQGSTGLALLLLHGGMLMRLSISSVAIVASISGPFMFSLSAYALCARDLLPVVIPFCFYVWDINVSNNHLKNKLQYCFYAYLIFSFYLLIGNAIDNASFALVVASCASWLAIISFSVLTLAIIAPLSQLLCTYFKYDILYHHISTLHVHRIMAHNCIFFSLVHIGFHIYHWVDDPLFAVNGKRLYFSYSPAIITGGGTMIFIAISTIAVVYGKAFKWHIYPTSFALLCLFFHGFHRVLGTAFGDNIVLFTVIICGLLHAILHLSHLSMTVTIAADHSTIHKVQGGLLVFLAVDAPHLPTVLPGSNFSICGTTKHFLRFDGHTASLFCSNPHQLVFMMFCSPSMSSVMNKVLTKVQIAKQKIKDTSLRLTLLGFFHSPASLMLEHVNNTSPAVLFLCARGLAYGSVVSMVSYLKENQIRRRLIHVYVFYDCDEEIVNIIEAELGKFLNVGQPTAAQNNLQYFAKPPEDQRHVTQFALSYVENLHISAEARKVVYYCGPEGNGKLLNGFDATWQKYNDKFP